LANVKVRIQTQPGFANTLREALPKINQAEGLNGFYKSLVPLWMRQIPYTMMKFACFEKTIELLYKYVIVLFRGRVGRGRVHFWIPRVVRVSSFDPFAISVR